MKSKIIYLFLFLSLLVLPLTVKAATDVITNKKLHDALIQNEYPIDSNGDGILSQSEVSSFNGTLFLEGKGLTSDDISELSKFTNVSEIRLAKNQINDLTPFLNLDHLTYLDISGNPYDCTFLRSFDKCENLYTLRNKLVNNEGNLPSGGLIIDYDKEQILSTTPEYKVLLIIVKDTDADVTLLNGDNSHTEYHMSDLDIELIKEYGRLFEMYVEKLSGYKVNIVMDTYVTKNTLTEIPANGATVNGVESSIFGKDVPEVQDILSDYDSSITVAYSHFSTHSFSGLGGFEGSIQRGNVYIPFDQNIYGFFISFFGSKSETQRQQILNAVNYNLNDFETDVNRYDEINMGDVLNQLFALNRNGIDAEIRKEIANLKNNVVLDARVDTFVHEFIHTLESFQLIREINTWEFHNALRFGQEYPGLTINTSDQNDYEGLYLRGYSNPDANDELGIQEEIYLNPPTKYYTTTLTDIENTEVGIVVDEDLLTATLSWNAVDGATQYKVLRGTDENNINEIINFSNETSYVDTIDTGTTYYYRVVAIKTDGVQVKRSADSNIVNAYIKPKTVDTNPVLNAVINDKNVTLLFDEVENATLYKLYRSEKATSGFVAISNNVEGTQYVDKNLTYGKTYYYKVVASNDLNSKESNVVKATIKVPNITGFKVTPGIKKTKVSWSNMKASGYDLYYSTDNKKWTKLGTLTTTSYTHKNLKDNKTYYYKIRSYVLVNKKKVYSDYLVLKTKTSPVVPKYKLSSSKYDRITTTITKVSGASYYEIYRSTSKSGKYTKIASVSELKYTDLTVLPTVTYFYKVRVCNTYKACSSYGSILSLKTKIKVPSKLTKKTSGSTIVLSYGASTGSNGYEIYRATELNGKYKKIGTTTELTYTDSTTIPNKVYYYKVRSFIKVNSKKYYSAYSNIVNTKVGIPQVKKVTLASAETGVAIAYSNIKGVSGYQIYRSDTKNGKYKKVKSIGETNYIDIGAENNKKYYYKVRAYKVVDSKTYYGNYSDIVSITYSYEAE